MCSGGSGCIARQAASIPSPIHAPREAIAAGQTKLRKARKNPAASRMQTISTFNAGKGFDAAHGKRKCERPSKMPPANAAAIATAGNFMKPFATSPRFRCGKSAGKDRTDELPQFRICAPRESQSPSCARNLSVWKGHEPTWQDRTIDTQYPGRQDWRAAQPVLRQGPRVADPK